MPLLRMLELVFHDELVAFSGIEGTQSRARLERQRTLLEKARGRKKDYLKARRTTYQLMRRLRHPRWALASYRADEVGGTEGEIIQSEEELAWLESDLELLDQPKRVEKYRYYAAEVMDRVGQYHIQYTAAN